MPLGLDAQQSALIPGGPVAEAIAALGWTMFAGAGAIFLGLIALAGAAHWGNHAVRRHLASQQFVVVGGIVFPVVVLTSLLCYGLVLAGAAGAPARSDALRIKVTGEQWWWRVAYPAYDGSAAAAGANEIHIPAGRQIEIELSSADVIHSFWVPTLAGKVDMIPGMVNRIRLQATRTGNYRGQCAEYCGGPHALMALYLVVQEPDEFEQWLMKQGQGGAVSVTDIQKLGESLFLSNGCHACHAIRGTRAAGIIGPDLTHVGGRLSIAAATLASDGPSIARWIRDHQRIKPNNRMPPFAMLSARDIEALAAYLENLE
jgi:cytochrome c oxidase subunit 2